MFGFSKKDTYSYKMVMSLSCDRSNIVHDIHGEFTLKDGETVEDGRDGIIEEYIAMHRFKNAHPVQILSFSCK